MRRYTVAILVFLLLATAALAAPKDDKLWITRLDDGAGFQIVVPDLHVKEIHTDPVQAVESVFADIREADNEVLRLQKRIEELQVELIIAQQNAIAAQGMIAIYDVAKDAAELLTRHTFWVEKYGLIKEVAVTGLMAGKHRVAFAWSRMHPNDDVE